MAAKGLFVQGAGWRNVSFPILSVLIERDNNLVLFDTGIGTRVNEEMRPPIYWGNLFFTAASCALNSCYSVTPWCTNYNGSVSNIVYRAAMT